ncbi:MAG: cytochrome c biogenesis protein ResB [Prevotella sp.]
MQNKWLFTTIVVLLALQGVFGNVDVRLFAFPVGFALGMAAVVVPFVVEREYGDKPWVKAFRSPRMACQLLAVIALWCIVGGSLPQGAEATDGIMHVLRNLGFLDFTTSLPFVFLLVALLLHLAIVVFHRLRTFRLRRDASFLLIHFGLWLALFCGIDGAADTKELRCAVVRGSATQTAYDSDGRVTTLPYKLQLRDFSIETNPADGSPTQYSATVLLDSVPVSLAVNSPYAISLCEDLYLMSFDKTDSYASDYYCILQITRQPAKYPMLAGIVLLLVGAVSRRSIKLKIKN